MYRFPTLILVLVLLLLGGCGERHGESPVVDIAIGLVQQSDSLIDVIYRLQKENWQLEYDKWKLHCKLTGLQVLVDTLYQMPPGTWVDADEFYTFYLNQLTDSQRFKNQIFPWPDSMFFLSK